MSRRAARSRVGGFTASRFALALGLAVAAAGSAVVAQPADLPIPAASGEKLPPGVHVIKTPRGAVYVDARGRVLYGMDMRTLLRWGPDPAQHCVERCAVVWEPLLAPQGAQPNIAFPRERDRRGKDEGNKPGAPGGFFSARNAPDWTVIAGPQGPQWVYKAWHVVFTRRGEEASSTAFDGAEDRTWNTLKFVPPAPKISAPTKVQPVYVDGAYVLADGDGRVLFTGRCAKTCGGWRPFAAGMASGPIGAWAVKGDSDTAQWTYRGRPVYVSDEDNPLVAPVSGKPLRP